MPTVDPPRLAVTDPRNYRGSRQTSLAVSHQSPIICTRLVSRSLTAVRLPLMSAYRTEEDILIEFL